MTEPVLLNRIKVHRALHDLTQAAVAERIGVSRRSINAIENGEFVPSTALALRLARLFAVPVEHLFRLSDAPEEWPLGG